jgi:tetratricopeptide (TPR) repeat protein
MNDVMPDWDAIEKLPFEERIPLYLRHLEKKPRDAAIWFDLGLAYKHLHQWKECIEANERALSISRAAEDPAWWNLGIAATALRDWVRARRAWRGYGLVIDGEDGPITCKYGMAPVRLPHGEVVWGDRIDPARLTIRNIPRPESEYRWGDVVLHDGEPNGERVVNGRTVGVFDVFMRWSPSEIPTHQAAVTCPSQEDSKALIELFDDHHFAAEDWSANVRRLCRACSTGNPDGHTHAFGTTETDRIFGLASPRGLAERLLSTWAARGRGRAFSDLQAIE